MVKIYCEPECESGTNRGGEDLNLNFTAFHDGDTPPVGEEFTVFFAVNDDWRGGRTELNDPDDKFEDLLNESEDDYKEYENGYGRVPVRFETCHYEFEWEGTPADALKLCESHFRDPANWQYCHKPGQPPRLSCTTTHYVNGNAD